VISEGKASPWRAREGVREREGRCEGRGGGGTIDSLLQSGDVIPKPMVRNEMGPLDWGLTHLTVSSLISVPTIW
jgi:hypothetical protein